MKYMNKKGMDVSYSAIIFLTLNIIFISIMIVFVSSSGNNSLLHEQIYAKEIALFLDSAKPGMEILLNFDKGFEIAKGNNREVNLVKIDEENNEVQVSLRSSGGYNMTYFTNYNVTLVENSKQKWIYLKVEKNDE